MQKKQKEKMRSELLSLRDSLSEGDVSSKSSKIFDCLISIPEVQAANSIAVYSPIRNEVDTTDFSKWIIKSGKTLLLPVTLDREIVFCQISSLDELIEGKFGILEPRKKSPFGGEIDVILIPGVCFDEHLHRLGYGKGYYDRYLVNSSAYKIGVCYDFQVVSELPIENFDVPLDEIVTELRQIRKHSPLR